MATVSTSQPVGQSPARRGSAAILEAAERLFGEFGIDGISTRRIIHAAGMVNNSAVIYHFGDRTGLLRALFEWRAPELEASASALYAAAAEQSRLSDPATLIGILLCPFLEVTDEEGRYTHAAFMYQALRSPEARTIRLSIHGRFEATARALQHLIDTLDHIPQTLVIFRLRLAAVLFFEGLIEQHRSPRTAELPELPIDLLVPDMIAACSALVTGPVDPALAAAAAG